MYSTPRSPTISHPLSPPRHRSLATRLERWSAHPSLHLHLFPRVGWTLSLLLPGSFLLLGMTLFSQVHQPVGFVLAVFAVGGFFWSLTGHRLSHDSRWPNPALFGALLSGIAHTTVCYFSAVLPNILPPLCTCMCRNRYCALYGATLHDIVHVQ